METRSLALWRGAMTHRSRITHTEREKESGDGTRDREKSLNQSVNSISHFVYFNLFKQIHANRWCQCGEDTMASTSNARMIGTIARNTHFFLTFLVCLFFSFSHRTYLRRNAFSCIRICSAALRQHAMKFDGVIAAKTSSVSAAFFGFHLISCALHIAFKETTMVKVCRWEYLLFVERRSEAQQNRSFRLDFVIRMVRIEIRISIEFNWMFFFCYLVFPDVLHAFFSATVILGVARVRLHEKMERYNRRTNASKSNLPSARKNSENERTYLKWKRNSR